MRFPEVCAAVMSFPIARPSLLAGRQPQSLLVPVIPLRCDRWAKLSYIQQLVIVTLLACGLFTGFNVVNPVTVSADTKLIPSVSLSERYDTNVFFAPPEFLPPGQRRSDFVSTIGGGMQVIHKTRDVEASFLGGADANAYAYNTGLNYFSTNAEAYAKLDGWAGRLTEGAHLLISDRFRYTPEQPSFLTGTKAQTIEDPFLRGIQGFRANTFSNTAAVNGEYPIFRGLGLQGSYSFSTYRIGSILVLNSNGAAFFDTNVHSWSIGPSYRISPVDHLSLSYQQSLVTQTLSGGGPRIEFNTQELWANYTRVLPEWTVTFRGGATLIEPSSQGFPTAVLTITTNPDRATSFRLDLSRRAAPSFFVIGGATISNVGQLVMTQRLSKRFSLEGSLSYGYNETVPGKTVTFENLNAVAGIKYNLTRAMTVDLSYNHSDFKLTQVGVLPFEVPRDVVLLSLTGQWK